MSTPTRTTPRAHRRLPTVPADIDMADLSSVGGMFDDVITPGTPAGMSATSGPGTPTIQTMTVNPDEQGVASRRIDCGGRPYLTRTMAGHDDVSVLRTMRERGIHVLLKGPSGSGKTMLAQAAHGDALYTLTGNESVTVGQLVGQLLPTSDGGFRYQMGPLALAMKEGRPLLLDEVNRLNGETRNALLPALDYRGTITLPDVPPGSGIDPTIHAAAGFCVVATMNERQRDTTPLSEALLRRLPVPIEVHSSWDTADALGVDVRYVTVCRNLDLKRQHDPDAGVWVPQLDALLNAKLLLDAGMGDQFVASTWMGLAPDQVARDHLAPALADALGVRGEPLHLT